LEHYIWIEAEPLIPNESLPQVYHSLVVDPVIKYTTDETFGVTSFAAKPSVFQRMWKRVDPTAVPIFREKLHMAHRQIQIVVDLSGTLWETPPPEYDRTFATLRHDFSGEIEFELIRTRVHLDEHHEEGLKHALTLITRQLEHTVGIRTKVCVFVGTFNERLEHYFWIEAFMQQIPVTNVT